MFSSKLIFHVFILLLVSEYCKSAECGPGGLCKYGGVCDSNNQCQCPITCSSRSWEFDINDLYCLPRQGRKPQIFFGICFALAEACELQQDIPLIKYDLFTGQCSASNELQERFCSSPHTFMGTCGGTLRGTDSLSSYDGGVCLQTAGIEEFRCRCPKGRSGARCEEKALPSNGMNVKNSSNTKIIGVSIGASVVTALLVCALIRRCRQSKSKRQDTDRSAAEEGITSGSTEKIHNSNRAEEDITSIQSLSNFEIESISETKPAPSQTTQTKISTAAKASPRRQRLTGYSPTNSEDTNNNLDATHPMIPSSTRIPDGTVEGTRSNSINKVYYNVQIV